MFKLIVSFLIGSFIGFISWGNDYKFTIFSILIFYAFLILENKKYLALVVLGYYLVGIRGLLIGTLEYYQDYKYGVSFWIVSSLLLTVPYILLHKKKNKVFNLILVIFILILPGFGFINFINPINSIGLIFPGFGFYAFPLFMILFIIINQLYRFNIIYSHLSIFSLICIGLLNSYIYTPKITSNFTNINSKFDFGTGEIDYIKEFHRQQKYLKEINSSEKDIFILPENAIGFYNSSSSLIWDSLDKNKIVLTGANIQINNKYDNILLKLTSTDSEIIYKQRIPVLFSMWTPFSETGANSHILENPIVEFNNIKLGVFICYEQLLTFSYLHSFYYEPKEILAISNLWWARDTNILQIEKENVELFSILFNVPYSFAYNE